MFILDRPAHLNRSMQSDTEYWQSINIYWQIIILDHRAPGWNITRHALESVDPEWSSSPSCSFAFSASTLTNIILDHRAPDSNITRQALESVDALWSLFSFSFSIFHFQSWQNIMFDHPAPRENISFGDPVSTRICRCIVIFLSSCILTCVLRVRIHFSSKHTSSYQAKRGAVKL